MQFSPKNLSATNRREFETLIRPIPYRSPGLGTWLTVLAFLAVSLALAPIAYAQEGMPNPIAERNPLTATLSIFRSNMQDKIMKSADAMPEATYTYRPTKDVRSFAEILNHVADISFTLCSSVKGEANPATAAPKRSKAEIKAYLKASFEYCDAVYSGFTDAHLNDPADFWGTKTNKMFVLTQVANHDALHYGNLVTYLRINGQEPSGGWF
jgi:uncharacterized damage-inducible protein DinB